MSFYSNTIRPHVISKQQIKRAAEFRDKSKEVIGRTLGNRKDEMVLLGDLATHPLYQGRGYGSALVKLVKDHADTGCRDIWLLSSNIKNTGFYNSLGFFTHGEIILGEDDPSWTRPPVIINLMVREYQSKVRTSV
ncbi:hypothetical protein BDW22DRAFT_470807 [Trametopsis cervina]|nr:hypothetical protein BDW22DRAFT_470807 [Trametopsis cervina]